MNTLKDGLGFKGVVITDDINKLSEESGISVGEAALRAVNAGADMIYVSGDLESVYTSIDWENDSFSVNNHHDRDYFLKYLNLVKNCGKDRYAIEYTTSGRIARKAAMLAKSRGYTVYIADSLELK